MPPFWECIFLTLALLSPDTTHCGAHPADTWRHSQWIPLQCSAKWDVLYLDLGRSVLCSAYATSARRWEISEEV